MAGSKSELTNEALNPNGRHMWDVPIVAFTDEFLHVRCPRAIAGAVLGPTNRFTRKNLYWSGATYLAFSLRSSRSSFSI